MFLHVMQQHKCHDCIIQPYRQVLDTFGESTNLSHCSLRVLHLQKHKHFASNPLEFNSRAQRRLLLDFESNSMR